MQNKGAIRFIAIAMAVVCLYQLSFTLITRREEKKAVAFATVEYGVVDRKRESHYLDSISSATVYNLGLVKYTYKECKEREINLGLDLKGGMNVMLEVSVTDLVYALAGNSTDSAFVQAMNVAKATLGNAHFIDKFGDAFKQVAPNARLASIFNTPDLKDKIDYNSSNDDVLRVLKEEAESAISNSFNILRNRIDKFGVSQPNIQRLENSGLVLIELPGVKEPERVRKLLQGTASLEFWETYEFSELFNSFMAANAKVAEIRALTAQEADSTPSAKPATVEGDSTATDDLLAKIQSSEEADSSTSIQEANFARSYPLFALLSPNVNQNNEPSRGPVVGMAHYKDTAAINQMLAMEQVKAQFPRNVRFLWGVKSPKWDKTESLFELIAIKVTSRDGKAPLDGGAITDARESFSDMKSSAEVSMSMNSEGAKIWKRLTSENIGRSIAVVLDDCVYSFPTVQTEISGGQSQITGDFSINEAKDLANVLKSGKLPAPARIIQEQLVGPSLGQEAISSGINSFLVSLLIVLLYMVFYYGRSAGLAADFALLCNLFFIMGVLSSFGAVLTLPGIAGIVLTLGMAVDTNVLIFERIREELRSGKGINLAISEGFKNALSAIIDGNVTTLLTGVILYLFGTGPIRGFATTLVIGILTSLFCGIFITRLIILALAKRNVTLNFATKASAGLFRNMNIDFVGFRKKAYIISGAVAVVMIASLAISGLNPGIDFAGGRSYVVRFDRDVTTNEVSAALREVLGEAPEVKTYGGNSQVKITTKYRIADNDANVDNEVDSLFYVGLKPLLTADVSYEEFQTAYKQSSVKVGPTIAEDIKKDAVIAVTFALIVIFLYILLRFRHWTYGAGAVLALCHDALFIFGLFSLFYFRVPFDLEIDQQFIAAILTIIGYSINDTVVVFDRVREYMGLYPKRSFRDNINRAVNDTLSRTFSTSFSTLMVLIPMFLFGGEVIRGFIFALIFGVVAGTYSTICIAVPFAYTLEQRKLKAAKKQ
ncbi:MAG: protein translocase subunit SecDF [Bacteroidales bacterium]|nr:protein translocase subunit SecDF [Bacteroidales bacterium]